MTDPLVDKADSGRAATWLPLLRSFSATAPTWTIYKNADSALHGLGDVDSSASPGEWEDLSRIHALWSSDLGPRVVCEHIPGGINLVTLRRNDSHLWEVGIKERKTYRGSTLFRWDQVLSLSRSDDRGFRVVRRGAEGLIKLILNGIGPKGTSNWAALSAKGVGADLRADPRGATLASTALLGRRASLAAEDLISAVVSDGWDRGAARRIQRSAYVRLSLNPFLAASRLRFRRSGKRCPVTVALLDENRKVPSDARSWWGEVVASHPTSAGKW